MDYLKIVLKFKRNKLDILIGELYDIGIINLMIDDSGEENIITIYMSENERKEIVGLEELVARLGLDMNEEKMDNDVLYESYQEYYEKRVIDDKIIIVPAWEEYERKDDEIVIKLDSGMGWGNGQHETTSTCIKMINKYINKNDEVIDIGTGTAILAIVASKLGASKVEAVEIDQHSIPNAKRNIEINQVENITLRLGEINKINDFKADLVVANVVAEVIIDIKDTLRKYLKKDGILIASGISDGKLEKVEDTYSDKKIVQCISNNGWNTLVIKQ